MATTLTTMREWLKDDREEIEEQLGLLTWPQPEDNTKASRIYGLAARRPRGAPPIFDATFRERVKRHPDS